jgi:hypothetical protein
MGSENPVRVVSPIHVLPGVSRVFRHVAQDCVLSTRLFVGPRCRETQVERTISHLSAFIVQDAAESPNIYIRIPKSVDPFSATLTLISTRLLSAQVGRTHVELSLLLLTLCTDACLRRVYEDRGLRMCLSRCDF